VRPRIYVALPYRDTPEQMQEDEGWVRDILRLNCIPVCPHICFSDETYWARLNAEALMRCNGLALFSTWLISDVVLREKNCAQGNDIPIFLNSMELSKWLRRGA